MSMLYLYCDNENRPDRQPPAFILISIVNQILAVSYIIDQYRANSKVSGTARFTQIKIPNERSSVVSWYYFYFGWQRFATFIYRWFVLQFSQVANLHVRVINNRVLFSASVYKPSISIGQELGNHFKADMKKVNKTDIVHNVYSWYILFIKIVRVCYSLKRNCFIARLKFVILIA